VAISPDETTLVIASAGGRDLGAPLPGAAPLPATTQPTPQGTVSMIAMNDALFQQGDEIGEGCLRSPMFVPGQPTAVAFASDGTLVVQSREPARLILMFSGGMRMIELGGESRLDTGHELFHRDPGVGIACASCHGEGGDDGHTWKFSRIGRRRTQAVNIGLAGTEPFHWSGEMENLNTLMNEVFVGRMGAAPQSEPRLNALSSWIFQQRPPASLRNPQDEAALRGKALFESAEVGCAACHSGEKLTNNDNADVGTGLALQVPSLIGIGHRAPFMHTGCAATLRDRFDPECGGDQHGQTAGLDPAQIDDLVAYLESL
jgi:mono/diheme cytochrome c family protein